jgi:DNA-binding NarL/FixJ family response regulator
MPNEDNEPSRSNALEILLVDDHTHVRKLLRQMIETYDDLKIVGEAIDGEEAVLLAAKLKPAAVVIDAHLPRLNGVEATRLIKESNPSIAVIGLTAGAPQDDETAMLNAGAASVIDKADALDALHRGIVDAVNRVNSPV